jgi:hypothetical protein
MESKDSDQVEDTWLDKEEEESGGSQTRRCSDDDRLRKSQSISSPHKRGRSAEPRLAVKETKITDDEDGEGPAGTYLVVPTPSTSSASKSLVEPATTRRISSLGSFQFSRTDTPLTAGGFPRSPLLVSSASASTSPLSLPGSSQSGSTSPSTRFRLLDSLLQQSGGGVREGFILPLQTNPPQHSAPGNQDDDPTTSTASSNRRCTFPDTTPSFPKEERLFQLCEERVAQRRMVSVEREQCSSKEHAAISRIKDRGSSARQHRAVTVSRSQTWSFRDKPSPGHFLRQIKHLEEGNKTKETSGDGATVEPAINQEERVPTTVDSSTRSRTLPRSMSALGPRTERRTGKGVLARHSQGDTALSNTQTCLLMDYDSGKDWSYVPWSAGRPRDGDQ